MANIGGRSILKTVAADGIQSKGYYYYFFGTKYIYVFGTDSFSDSVVTNLLLGFLIGS